MLNYGLLAVTFGGWRIYRGGRLVRPWWCYAVLALVDVEANFLVVKVRGCSPLKFHDAAWALPFLSRPHDLCRLFSEGQPLGCQGGGHLTATRCCMGPAIACRDSFARDHRTFAKAGACRQEAVTAQSALKW